MHSFFTCIQVAEKKTTGSKNVTRNWMMTLFLVMSAMISSLTSFAQPLTGTKNVPVDYPTLAAAITDLNLQGVGAGGVTISVTAGNPQTAPAGGYSITTLTGTLANQIVIAGNGNTITAPNPQATGALNDAIFKIIGADYVTLQGFTMQENALNTTTVAATNNMTEWGIAVLYATTTNGAQNITLQNNTISLNRTYQNTFGIYSNSTHSATSVTAAASATTTAGANNDLKIYGNAISNVNNGIVVVGPTAAADYNTGVDIGGTSLSTANTLTNFGTTGTFSGYANVSGSVFGILVRNLTGFNVSYNSITSSSGGVTAGTLRGIYVPAFTVAPTGTFTNNINNNTVSLTYGIATGTLQGITVEATTGTATATQNINDNNFTALTGSIATSATITAISDVMTNLVTNINNNKLTNITTNTSGAFTFIAHGYTVPAGGTQNINGNSIVTAFNKTGGAGALTMMSSPTSTIAATTVSHSNNNFSNITVTGTSAITGISNSDGTASIAYGRTVTGNTMSNWTAGTGAIIGISYLYWGGAATLSNNTISNLTGQGAITGITIGSSGNTANPLTINGNTVSNLSSTGTGGAVVGITSSNTSPAIIFSNNIINTLSSTGASAVTGLSNTGASASVNIFKNKIYGLSGSNASSTINGMLVSTGTVNIYNNIIGDLQAPVANAANPVIGLSITGGTTMNVVYNTIYLNATSSGALFGSSAISVSTTPAATLGNNVLINTSTANGATGFTVAYRRSTTTLTSYQNASNKNILYAGTPGPNNLIFYDGSNADQTVIAFKLRVGPTRDALSFSENVNFLSTTGSSSNFLHINPAIPTLLEGSATVVAGITDDFDGDTRNVSTPDIGADEFNGTAIVLHTLNSISINPTGSLCTAAGRTVTANVTIGDNPVTSITLNYSFNGGASVPVTMTGGTNTANTTSNWTATIPVGTPADANVTWSVTTVEPLATRILTGAAYRDEPFTGASVSISVSPNPTCAGAATILTASTSVGGTDVTLGAGATTTSTYNAPFYSAWSNKHEQIMVKQSELAAAGLKAGPITALSFPTTSGTLVPLDYTIKMAHTAATDMSAFVTTGLTQVYFAASQPQVANTNNKLTLNTPFIWDGTSNLVIDICFGNAGSTATLASTSPADATSYVSVIKTNTNAATSAAVSCPDLTSNLLTYSVRPKIIFTGVGPVSLPNYVWNDGTSNIGSTNPLTVYPLANTSYTVTGTDVNGCTITSLTPYTVTTITGPTPPSGTNSGQCGLAYPTAFVVSNIGGDGTGFRWYNAQFGGTLLQTGGGLYTTSMISTTTTFWVSETNGTCESLRTPVTVTVTSPDPIQASVNSNSVCLNSTISLSAANIAGSPVNNYTYSWTASPEAGSGITGSIPGSPLSVQPTTAGTYTYTVTAIDGSCTITTTVSVTVKSLPLVTSVTANPGAVCSGISSQLTAQSIPAAAGTATVGAGATTSATYPAPFYSLWSNKHEQILIKASELTAAGLTTGNITTLSFPTTAGTISLVDFSIKLAQTNATTMSSFVTTGLTQVYFAASQPQVANTNNTITLNTPYNWDGTSNLVIDICFGNGASSATLSSTSPADNTSYVSVIKTHTSAATAAAISCPDITSQVLTYSVRPKILIGGQIGVNNTANYNWSWSPDNLTGSTVSVSPIITTTYTATATDPVTTCSGTNTVTLTIYDLPAAPSGNSSDQCGELIPLASVSSNSGAPTPLFRWYDAPTGGTLLQSSTSTTYLQAISVTTDFYVAEFSADGCEGPRTQVTVTVGDADPVTALVNDNSVCPNSPISLSATQTGNTNTYVYTWTASPTAGSGIPTNEVGNPVTVTPTLPGTYTYTVTAFDESKGCTDISTVVVTVNEFPFISSASANPATICAGSSTTLTALTSDALPGFINVGTQTTTIGGNDGNPYRSGNGTGNEIKTQLLVTAAELTSAGLSVGNITSLGFTTTGIGGTVDNFIIKMAHTTVTTLNGTFETPTFTTVFTQPSFTTVLGLNTHVFSTPFNWNGTSNIVIEICQVNAAQGTNTVAAFTPAYASNTHKSTSTTSCTSTTGTPVATKPIMRFGGLVGSTGPGTYSWTWNPGNLSGNSVPVSPTSTTSYTATATDANGCVNTSSPVTVTVLALPNPPVATPSTQCGLAVPTASVSTGGANGTYKWYSAQTGGTLLQTGGSTYTTAISSTTSFWVSESDATCESPRAEVVVTVTQPDAINATVNDNSVCFGSSIQLSVAQEGTSNTYTYTWTANPSTGSGIPTSVTGTPVTVTPTVDGTYTYTVTGVDASGPNTCTVTSTISVTINPLPVISSVTATPPVICNGGSSVLEVKSNIGSPLSAKIGTGTTGFTGAANPYWRSGESSKNQMLYRASDLINAGFTAGPINGISFFVTSSPAPGINFVDYTISLLHTNLTAITTTTEPGGQLVFGPATFDVTAGTNTHLFNTPFIWDGVSNIIVQTCYNNDYTNTCTTCAGSTPAVEYTSAVGYNASSYLYGTNTTSATWDFCVGNLSSTGNSTQANLPNATFIRTFTNNTGLYNWSWASTPAGTYPSTAIITVTPNTTTTYTPTATEPISGCVSVGTPVTVTVNPTPSAPVTNGPIVKCGAGPVTMTATNTGGTMNWYTASTGGSPVASGDSYSPTVLASTSYWVAETYATGNCEGPRTEVVITINTAPNLTITAAGPTTYCVGGSVALDASLAPSDPSYVNFSWSPATGLNTTTGAQVTANPSTTTTYTLTANDGIPVTGCSNITTITITVNPNPVITSATATPASLCAGGTTTLAAVSIPATAGTATVGAGATTSATYPAAFYSLWSNKHEQILIPAAELTAAGLTTGNITTLSFPTTAGTLSMVDFSIKMAQTNAANMSAFVTTGLSQVYFAASQPQVANTNNTLTLNTPFFWNGTSNLVIDICFGNASSGATMSCTAPADNTAYVSVIKTHTSAGTAASIACPDITSQVLTYTVRPKILIGGQIGVNNTANFNWTWNPGNISAGTTGSTSVSPTSTTTYTATATNPTTGCFTNSAPVTVTVTPVIANATATASTICAGATSTLSANPIGGAPFTYAWSDGTATVYPATATISVTPAVTTTYTVTVNDACSNTTTSSVTVTVNPLPTSGIQEAGPITICFPATQVLTATTNAASPTYQWTLNGTNIPSATNATYTVSGVSTGTYRVIVTNTVTGCISAPSTGVAVTINQQPSAVSISPVSATICAGSPQSLTASGGTINTLGSGAISGTPTSNQTTTGSPYRSGAGANYQIKQQMLVRASELVAMGIPANTPTSLNSLGFTTPTTATGTFTGFTIAIANTSATTLTTTFLTTPLTTVFTAASYSPVANSVNTHIFQTPFLWDGVSNIVIETRQTNSTLGTAGVVCYTPAGITASVVYSGSTTGFAATTGTTATLRPIMNFSFGSTTATNFTWSPSTGLNTTSGATVIASPEVTTTYTATATSTLGCTNTAQVTITANPRPTGVISGSASYCSGAGLPTQLSIAVTGTGPWSGTLSNGTTFSGSSSPILVTVPAVTSTTTYTIATLNGALCNSIPADLTGSATVTINPLAGTPTASVLQPTCVLGTGTITVTAPLGAGNTYSIGGPFQSSVTFAGVAPGTYTLSVQNSFGCFAPATASVTVNPQPFTPGAAVVTGPTNVCPFVGTGEPVTFTATAAGATSYNWVLPPNVAIVSGQGTGTLVVTFAPGFTAQNNKQLRVTASSICGNAPQTIYYLLAQFPNTPGPISGPTDACPLLGNTATYSVAAVPGAVSYVWNAQAGTVITPAGPGTQGNTVTISFPTGFTTSAVTVQTQNDCGVSGVRSLTITRNNPSTPSLIAGPTNVCANIAPGGTPATYSVTATAGTTYTWTVPNNVIGLTGQGTNTISFTYPAAFTGGTVQVLATNGCGTSGTRSLSVTKLNPATPSVIDVIQTATCPDRVFTYTIAGMPANATSVQWTVPTLSGAILVSGQGTTSITVSYPATAVQGVVTAQAVNNCGVSVTRESSVKLPACPPPTFTKGTLQPATTPVVTVADMQVDVFPNPTVSDFKLRVLTASKEIINVRVLDAAGRAFKQFTLMPYETMSLGKELRAGAYIIEVRQGKEMKSTKVLKF